MIAKAYSEEKTPHKKLLGVFHSRMEKMESRDLIPMSAKTQINYYKVLSKAVEKFPKFPKDMCGIIDQHFPRAKQAVALEKAREDILEHFIEKHKELKADGKYFDKAAIKESEEFIKKTLEPAKLNKDQMEAVTNGINGFVMTTANSMGDLSWGEKFRHTFNTMIEKIVHLGRKTEKQSKCEEVVGKYSDMVTKARSKLPEGKSR